MSHNGTHFSGLDPEQEKLKGKGWDHAIDVMVVQIQKQIEGLRNHAKQHSMTNDVKIAIDVCAKFIENLKKAKGNVEQQQFSVEEVREIVDNVTGSVLMANKSIMEYYDEFWMPKYMRGEMEMQKFTEKKDPIV